MFMVGGIELNKIDRTSEKKLSSIDRYSFYKNNHNTYYIIDKDIIIGAVIGQEIIFCNTEYFVVLGVNVSNEYRGKVLGSQMYNYIMHYTQRNLMSDNEQTITGKALWKTIAKTHNVKVLDLLTCEILDNIDDAYNGSENLVLVTNETITESIIIPTFRKRS
jgi:hypothetical protein